jgi:acetylornithine aminotransferase
MLAGFKAKLKGTEGVKAIRSAGFMFGIELTIPCADLVKQALAKGILINVTAEKVIRLLPPLVINVDEANQIVSMVSDLVINFLSSQTVESVA